MKKILLFLFSLSLFVYGIGNITEINAADPYNKVVYFYSKDCLGCQSLIGGNFYENTPDGDYDTSDPNYDSSKDYIKRIIMIF